MNVCREDSVPQSHEIFDYNIMFGKPLPYESRQVKCPYYRAVGWT
jgi:hypothetical protein